MLTLVLVHETVSLHDAMRSVNNSRSLEIFHGGSRGADRPSSSGCDRRGVIALGGFGQRVLAVPGGLSLWNELLEKVMWLSSWRCRNRGACKRYSLRFHGLPLSNTAPDAFGDQVASLCDLLCIYSCMS